MVETEEVPWRPRHNPWAVAMTVTLATFMEILDTSVANVSLPKIAGNLSVTQSVLSNLSNGLRDPITEEVHTLILGKAITGEDAFS